MRVPMRAKAMRYGEPLIQDKGGSHALRGTPEKKGGSQATSFQKRHGPS